MRHDAKPVNAVRCSQAQVPFVVERSCRAKRRPGPIRKTASLNLDLGNWAARVSEQ